MKRGATREEIIRTTQELITRNGIRAVRVDEIAQTLGISKRTLYELFTDKTDLVTNCLLEMSRHQQQRIIQCCAQRSGTPLQKAIRVLNEYIDGLFTVESSFLSDVRRKQVFADQFAEHRMFWSRELTQVLEQCRQTQLMLPEIDSALFADCILSTLFELRLSRISRKETQLFSRTLMRGAATRQGIEQIDSDAC